MVHTTATVVIMSVCNGATISLKSCESTIVGFLGFILLIFAFAAKLAAHSLPGE